VHIDLVDLFVDANTGGSHLEAAEKASLATNLERLTEYQCTIHHVEVDALVHLPRVSEDHQRARQVRGEKHAMPARYVVGHAGIVRRVHRRAASTVVGMAALLTDLHSHSTASDGKLSPTELVELAAARGIGLLGLTDHDTLRGIAEAQVAGARLGVHVLHGIEISGRYPGGQCHLLAWLPDPVPAKFVEWTYEKEHDREERAHAMVELLQDNGSKITWDDVRARAAVNIGRPHVADALVAVGEAVDRKDAFARWIGNNCVGYVSSGKTEPAEVIGLVVEAGGLVSLAHPYSLNLEGAALEAYIQELADAGLGAIEAHRGDQDAATQADYAGLARRHGLLVSVGSDFHEHRRETDRRRELGWGGDPGIADGDLAALLSRLPGVPASLLS